MKRCLLIGLCLMAVGVYLVLELAPPEVLRHINFLHFRIAGINAIGNELTVHFLMCFLLTLCILSVLKIWRGRHLPFNLVLLVALLMLVFAVMGEVTQSLMGMGRAFALDDIAVSALGIALATDITLLRFVKKSLNKKN